MPPKHFPMPILSSRIVQILFGFDRRRSWTSGSASETESVLVARCRYVQPTGFVCWYSSESAQVAGAPQCKPSFFAYLGTLGQLVGAPAAAGYRDAGVT